MGFGCERTNLSDEILNLYAEGPDGLSEKDCEQLREDYGLTMAQTNALEKALGKGAEGFITQEEYNELTGAGFATSTLNALKGNNYCASIYRRSLWLSDNVDTKMLRSDYDPETRQAMLQELQDMAPVLKGHGLDGGVDTKSLADIIRGSSIDPTFDDDNGVRWEAFNTLIKYAQPEDIDLVKKCADEFGRAYTRETIDYFARSMSWSPSKAVDALLNIEEGPTQAYALDRLAETVPPKESSYVLLYLMKRLKNNGPGGDAAESAIVKLMARPECAKRIADELPNMRNELSRDVLNRVLKDPVALERISRIASKSESAKNILNGAN